ncbi:probable U3 small nucleolar RNA-associated protein 11 isoform X2 [Rhineura floridana]|uniref:probable U3 small nucleolar RNA-associated protein 11 isoform X2 n=1 Tax=Rhineura floridana TaxID=261503 RepID=UPI002AC7EEFC|nr:probable U3 small nucleolar RNA-associated protein 11 isoform X2 [Rhineura floridana]
MAAAFKKAAKSGQRQHRERAQPASRKRLGILEKKKDYQLRADDYHKKQNVLQALRKKAQEKNPDEFYFKMARVQLQKIERLKSELHLLDAEGKQPNKHTFFFDTKKEVQGFDVAAHLNTAPELVGRVYNRPTLPRLQKEAVQGANTAAQLRKLARQRKSQYHLLRQRIERERKMFVVAQKLQTRKDLLDKAQKVKLKKETVNQPAIYKFQFRRKR